MTPIQTGVPSGQDLVFRGCCAARPGLHMEDAQTNAACFIYLARSNR